MFAQFIRLQGGKEADALAPDKKKTRITWKGDLAFLVGGLTTAVRLLSLSYMGNMGNQGFFKVKDVNFLRSCKDDGFVAFTSLGLFFACNTYRRRWVLPYVFASFASFAIKAIYILNFPKSNPEWLFQLQLGIVGSQSMLIVSKLMMMALLSIRIYANPEKSYTCQQYLQIYPGIGINGSNGPTHVVCESEKLSTPCNPEATSKDIIDLHNAYRALLVKRFELTNYHWMQFSPELHWISVALFKFCDAAYIINNIKPWQYSTYDREPVALTLLEYTNNTEGSKPFTINIAFQRQFSNTDVLSYTAPPLFKIGKLCSDCEQSYACGSESRYGFCVPLASENRMLFYMPMTNLVIVFIGIIGAINIVIMTLAWNTAQDDDDDETYVSAMIIKTDFPEVSPRQLPNKGANHNRKNVQQCGIREQLAAQRGPFDPFKPRS